MTIRVLHLIKGLGPGGAEQLLVNQARATDDDELEFRVAYLVSWKNHLCGQLEAEGWVTSCLNGDRVWDLRWVLRLRRLIRSQHIDVLHGHSPLVSSLARLVLRTLPQKQRPRSIYTEHNEWARHRPWTRRFNRWTIGFEDELKAVSEGVKESMPTRLDIGVLIHGIDVDTVAAQLDSRDDVRSELQITPDEHVIGIVANFRHEKAYDVLLEAAAKVIASDPRIRFVSVGQGPLESEIRGRHERLGLGDRFLILGYREDATRVMSAFDVFTLTSRHEGLPVSIMEAQALRIPIVATAVGGIPEAVQGYSSVLIHELDAAVLADAYLATGERSHRWSSPAASPDRRFDARFAAQALADVYRSLDRAGCGGYDGCSGANPEVVDE